MLELVDERVRIHRTMLVFPHPSGAVTAPSGLGEQRCGTLVSLGFIECSRPEHSLRWSVRDAACLRGTV
jgi:hypothetical protein